MRKNRARTARRIAMHYDFTTIMDRRGKDALAVDALGNPGVPGAPK